MLKCCLECLAGDRRDDAVYTPNIISLNGRGATLEAENMLKLRVPKVINLGDTIKIDGAFKEDKKIFEIYLTEGISEPDIEKKSFYLKIDFENETNYSESREFNIEMKFLQENLITCIFNQDSLDGIKYEIPINNISFIVLNGDVSYVERLEFKYANTNF